jgi:hypothetical protein
MVLVENSVRLSALVNLQIQPPKGIFLPGHHNFPVQFQFHRTRQPLCLELHTNYCLWGPTCQPLFIPRLASLPIHLLDREPVSALPPCPLRRAGGARGGGPASSSPTRPSLDIPSAPLELPNAARPQAPPRGFFSGLCFAGLPISDGGESDAPWGIRRRIFALPAPAVPAPAPPSRAHRLLAPEDEGREDKPAEIELSAMEARSEAPSLAQGSPRSSSSPAVPARRPWLPPPLSPASPAPPSSSLPPSHGGTSRVVGRPVRRGVSRSAAKRARDGVRRIERDGPVPFPSRRCGGKTGISDLLFRPVQFASADSLREA